MISARNVADRASARKGPDPVATGGPDHRRRVPLRTGGELDRLGTALTKRHLRTLPVCTCLLLQMATTPCCFDIEDWTGCARRMRRASSCRRAGMRRRRSGPSRWRWLGVSPPCLRQFTALVWCGFTDAVPIRRSSAPWPREPGRRIAVVISAMYMDAVTHHGWRRRRSECNEKTKRRKIVAVVTH